MEWLFLEHIWMREEREKESRTLIAQEWTVRNRPEGWGCVQRMEAEGPPDIASIAHMSEGNGRFVFGRGLAGLQKAWITQFPGARVCNLGEKEEAYL